MPDSFDPYLKWLAILPSEQPANHYRLLALPLFVDDADVIESAADQRMAHVRTFGMGKHADLSQQILNEISAAKVLLLDPEKKTAYDKQLRAKRAKQKKTQRANSSSTTQRPKLKTRKAEPKKKASNPEPAGIEVSPRKSTAAARITRRKKKPAWQQPAVLGIGAVLLLAFAGAAVMLSGGEDPKVADSKTPSNKKSSTTSGSSRSTTKKPPRKTSRTTPDASSPFETTSPDVSNPKDDPDQGTPTTGESPKTTDQPPTFTFATTGTEPLEKPEENPGTQSTDDPESPIALPEPVEKRLPAPDEASLKAKQELLDELYGDRIKAARTKDAKAELAQLLLDAGRGTDRDPVGKYALLHTALKHAIESGSLELASESVADLAEEFEVDALQLNMNTLTSIARTIEDNEQRASVAQRAMDLTEDAILADGFDEAEKLSKIVASASGRLRDPKLRKASNALRARVRLAKVAWEASEEAIAVLENQPDDADAHLARGKYLALVKQDWQSGLPHLAEGSDTALAKIAQQEAAEPEAADARLALADAWYDWAGHASGAGKEGSMVRALHWYQNVLDDLSTQQAARVVPRVDELSEIVKPVKSDVVSLPWVKGPVGLIRQFSPHRGGVKFFDVSADGRYAMTCTTSNEFRVCDLATGEEKSTAVRGQPLPSTFSPDGGHVITQDGWTETALIDWRTGDRKWKFNSVDKPKSYTLLPNNPIALILGRDGTVRGLNYTNGKEEFRFSVPADTHEIKVTPDGRRALLGQDKSKAAIFDLTTHTALHQLEPPIGSASGATSIAISPDGRWGLTADSNSPALVWDLRTGKLVKTLATAKPVSGDFSPDSQRVTLSGPGKLDVWRLRTNTLIHSLSVPQSSGGWVRFTPDGRGLVSAVSATGIVRLHRIADPQ